MKHIEQSARPFESSNRTTFGQIINTPKTVFVQSDVHADPRLFGSTAGEYILTYENMQVLRELLTTGVSRTCKFDSLLGELQVASADMTDPILIVLNSDEIFERLTHPQGCQAAAALGTKSAPAVLLYVDGISEQVILVDRDTSFLMHFSPQTMDGDYVYTGERIGLRLYDSETNPDKVEVVLETGYGLYRREHESDPEAPHGHFFYVSDVTDYAGRSPLE